jgi:NAD(P)-dependent dehydrogenase (short-subunit alcohol dehydrogenase family)
VLAHSSSGTPFDTVAVLDQERFGAASLERPALTRTGDGRVRLYVSCATPGSKHWWIELLEARTPERLAQAAGSVVFPGDELTAVKDPVIRFASGRWHAWICCHPLDTPGEEDRMLTRYATSRDGVQWTSHGAALTPRTGTWDARGVRVTAVLPGAAYYDGRASKEENFRERTGLAVGVATAGLPTATLRAEGSQPVADVRYVDAVREPGGALRLFYEAPRPDGAHELRSERIPD